MVSPTLKLEHSDARGEIYSITLPGERELMLLHSVAGSLRGGHSHDCDEVVVVLSGKIRYHQIIEGSTTQLDLEAGQSSFHCAGDIHMGEFLEDTWLIEQKLARKGEWSQENYGPYRERVNANAAR